MFERAGSRLPRSWIGVGVTLLLTLIVLGAAGGVNAQTQCGIAASIRMPVDTARFRLVQDFAAPSPRHQGRYHTGEDWYGGEGTSYGEPVYAIANGRVTFSSPNGWGADGGVIIIEHTFAEGTIVYSMYGHITDRTGIQFPAQFSCVREGDILAAIGDARPAPHLHFEIRLRGSDLPGAGYSWENPQSLGLRRPSKFVANMATWLGAGYRWRIDLADETGPIAAPVQLEDHSLIFIDRTGAGVTRLSRASPDGRILWRVILDAPAVGVIPSGDSALLLYAGGRVQPVNRDGTLGQARELGIRLAGAPVFAGDLLLIPIEGGQIAAFDRSFTVERWRVGGGRILRAVSNGRAAALLTEQVGAAGRYELRVLSVTGELLDYALLREAGALAVSPDGTLMAFTRGGLWMINDTGEWRLAIDIFGGRGAGLAFGADGTLYTYDGSILRVYDAARMPLWEADVPDSAGLTEMLLDERGLLVASSDGTLFAVQPQTGALCRDARIYGSWRSGLWLRLNADGLLRVYAADQILGLDWRNFLLACG